MNGIIAQIVALTCFENAFLAGHHVPDFFPLNSTCVFCDRVNFVSVKRSILGVRREIEMSKTPDQWFAYLKSVGAKGIYLSLIHETNPRIPDWISRALSNAGKTWSIEVIVPGQKRCRWIPIWEVWDQNAPNKRIWRVTYQKSKSNPSPWQETVDLDNIIMRLTGVLTKVHAFSENHGCSGFTVAFADALDTLNSDGKVLHGYHRDLAPDGFLSLKALTVLDACQKAWVFGGMGSWNDLLFEGDAQKEYVRLSDQLLQAVNEAIAAGANSTFNAR